MVVVVVVVGKHYNGNISSNSNNARNINSDIGSISNRSNIDNSSNSNINGILGMFPICSSDLYLYMYNYIESL